MIVLSVIYKYIYISRNSYNNNLNIFIDINEKVMNNAAVALVNNEVLWHMHKPLPDSCKLEFLHYNHPQPGGVNKAFWRTCSFLLGAVASQAFKDKVDVQLHSFPIPNGNTSLII